MTSSPVLSSVLPVDRALTVITYLALVLFGIAQGMLGAFFYGSGPAPVASLAFDVAIFGTCLLGAWGMRSYLGGLAPAAGWFAAVLVLAESTSGGSVVITATAAGEWFLFGGALCAAAGLVAGFAGWVRPPRATRAQPGTRPGARPPSAAGGSTRHGSGTA
jgi:hypothetical protein